MVEVDAHGRNVQALVTVGGPCTVASMDVMKQVTGQMAGILQLAVSFPCHLQPRYTSPRSCKVGFSPTKPPLRIERFKDRTSILSQGGRWGLG